MIIVSVMYISVCYVLYCILYYNVYLYISEKPPRGQKTLG
jgi:hypothetical protein